MSRSFNGSSDYAEVGSSPVSGMPLTISAWFNAASLAAEGQIVAVNLGLEADFCLLLRTTGNIRARQAEASGTADSSSSGATVGTGSWNHGAAVFSSTTSRTVYLNGTAGTTATNTIATSTPTKVSIGTRYSAGTRIGFFNGKIAEVGIWNVVLTAAEITMLSLGYSPLLIRPQNLVAYYPLIGRNSPENDMKGTGLTLTGTSNADHCRIIMPRATWTRWALANGAGGTPPPPPTKKDGMFFAIA